MVPSVARRTSEKLTLESGYVPQKWALYLLASELELVPEREQKILLSKFIDQSKNWGGKKLLTKQVDSLVEPCRILPPYQRMWFLRHGLHWMLESEKFDASEAAYILNLIAENMAGPCNLLPPRALKFISSNGAHWCEETEDHFRNAGINGTLIEKVILFEGKPVRALIKGPFSFTGLLLGMPQSDFGKYPSNVYYSIKMKDGEVEGVQLAPFRCSRATSSPQDVDTPNKQPQPPLQPQLSPA